MVLKDFVAARGITARRKIPLDRSDLPALTGPGSVLVYADPSRMAASVGSGLVAGVARKFGGDSGAIRSVWTHLAAFSKAATHRNHLVSVT